MKKFNCREKPSPPPTTSLADCTPPELDGCLNELVSVVQNLADKLDVIQAKIDGQLKPFYSVEELAGMVDRSAYTIRRWISSGLIEAARVPGTGPKGRLLIRREELQKLVDQGLGEAIQPVVLG